MRPQFRFALMSGLLALLSLPALTVAQTAGPAVPQTAAATPRWAELLSPTLTTRQKACDALAAFEKVNPSPAGQKYTSAELPAEQTVGQQLTDRRSSPGVPERVVDNILVQLPAAIDAVICANAARENRTVDVKNVLTTTTFYVQTDIAMVRDALKFTATLRFLDQNGKLLAEVEQHHLSKPADPAQWERRCVEGECRWHGFSLFKFGFPRDSAQVISNLHTLQLVFDRGYGKETRNYVAADFTRTELKD